MNICEHVSRSLQMIGLCGMPGNSNWLDMVGRGDVSLLKIAPSPRRIVGKRSGSRTCCLCISTVVGLL